MENQTFEQAYEAMEKGNTARRKAWPKNVFAFMRPEDDLPIGVLLGAKSLPRKVKDYFERKHQPIVDPNQAQIKCTKYLCIKNEADEIQNGWAPGDADIKSTDWEYDEY
ncbi:MAG TPA: MW1434 family type I TA system toxin [Parapedobacter sp.]|uniref:Thoeris anti-defense Tad2 family protein n=1 Tax=Parapedobacter sp. TaxID=1958893 RepID=UPI002BEB8253|nr:MW1434 family type I TA system toxin [Parapedobacter sp.]HWK58115.1 MW1434 family type I TA system toxin [Parapedobacter sp.]